MKPSVILHQFPHSHYCIRIRSALRYKGIDFDVRNYRNSTTGDLQKVTGGYRLVPVLEWDGEIVCDSPTIARFLEEKVPSPSHYPGNATAALCDMVNGWVDTKVMLTAAKYFSNEFFKFIGNEEDRALYSARFQKIHGMPIEQAQTMKAELEPELLAHWELLDTALKADKYLFGDSVSYADFGVASRFKLMEVVGNYRIPETFPHVRDWYESLRELGR